MKAQATLEMMIIFVVTMAAIMMVFYPLAQAHKDFQKQADYIEKEQHLEDYLVGLQVYCNGGVGTSVTASSASTGCEILPKYGSVRFKCPEGESEFPGFFRGCVLSDAKRPV